MSKINFQEQFKIRVREKDLSQAKHLIVKSLIMLILKEKYSKKLKYNKIQSETAIGSKIICDIYHEDMKSNSIVCFEVQKDFSKKWIQESIDKYSKYRNVTPILIDINNLSDDINELAKELKEIVP